MAWNKDKEWIFCVIDGHHLIELMVEPGSMMWRSYARAILPFLLLIRGRAPQCNEGHLFWLEYHNWVICCLAKDEASFASWCESILEQSLHAFKKILFFVMWFFLSPKHQTIKLHKKWIAKSFKQCLLLINLLFGKVSSNIF